MRLWRRNGTTDQERFDREVLPHLDTGYNLARWLARSDDDASDIVQEACLRCFRNMDQLTTNPRAWFLSTVRNTAYTFLARRSGQPTFLDESDDLQWDGPSPEQAVLAKVEQEILTQFIEDLPPEFREVLVLRDLEDLSYKEIAEVSGLPIGTVMSRLNRARRRLQQRLADRSLEERRLGL